MDPEAVPPEELREPRPKRRRRLRGLASPHGEYDGEYDGGDHDGGDPDLGRPFGGSLGKEFWVFRESRRMAWVIVLVSAFLPIGVLALLFLGLGLPPAAAAVLTAALAPLVILVRAVAKGFVR